MDLAPPTTSRMTWRRSVLIALVWQAVPVGWLLVDSWDTPSSTTLILRLLVFLGVPLLSSLVHRSGRMGLACLTIPVLGIGLMLTGFMLLMPVGRW